MKSYGRLTSVIVLVFSLLLISSCSNGGNAEEAGGENEKAPETTQSETAQKPAPEKKRIEAPAFANLILRDLDGKPARLEKLADGKPVYVAFFLSGGGPCMAQVPRINKINKKYAGAGLAVFAASAQDPKEKLLRDREKYQMKYTLRVYYLKDNARDFRISAVPLNVVFDASGKLVYKNRMPPTDAVLDMLMSK